MDVKILKEKLENGEWYYGFEIKNHGFKGHPPVLSNWFATQEGFEKQILHYIGQYIGRSNRDKSKTVN